MKANDSINHWAHRALISLKMHIDSRSKDLGLASPEVMILHALDEMENGSLMKLARRVGKAHPPVLRHVDRLVAEGLVERLPHPVDRRVKTLRLTSKGKKTIPAVDEIINEIHGMALAGLDPSEIDTAVHVLRTIVNNLEHRDEEAGYEADTA